LEKAGNGILEHVKDSHYYDIFGYHLKLPEIPPVKVLGITFDFSITRMVVLLWIAALIISLCFLFSFRKRKLIPSKLGILLEYVILYIRDNIAYPILGRKLGDKYFPLISTLFLFILVCNLLGLVPLLGSPTSNLSVTSGLAIIVFVIIVLEGIKQHGLLGYFKSFIPGGIPAWLIPVMLPLEVLGLFIRIIVLAVRLFANMVSGHINIVVLFFLIIFLKTYLISPFSFGIALFVSLLEILVAFIQAYIFTMLSAIFISMSVKSH